MIKDSSEKKALRHELRTRFESYLSDKGMRHTTGRFKILDKCVDQASIFNIQSLYEDLREDYYVSLASVYQTVELLCDCDILRRHFLSENEASYEMAHNSNIHLICLECGSVFIQKIGESEEEEVKRVTDLIHGGEYRSFRPSYVSTNIYGRCVACRSKVN